jgi:hypothetical protein
MKNENPNESLLYSYMALRKAVGWIGILLPFTLMLGVWLIFSEKIIMRSISHYYHSGMGDVFVGAICAIALFLFFYKGYDNWGRIKWDNWLASLGGFFALGIALFPATNMGPSNWVGMVHLFCAAAFFIILACYALFIFTKTKKGSTPTPEKLARNRIYRACGIIMLACLLGILLFLNLGFDKSVSSFVFWAETVALVAFGVSWLVKGGVMMGDHRGQ